MQHCVVLRAASGIILEDSLALAIEEKYDQVRQLIAMGKERGYLLYDEVNDILPAEHVLAVPETAC